MGKFRFNESIHKASLYYQIPKYNLQSWFQHTIVGCITVGGYVLSLRISSYKCIA